MIFLKLLILVVGIILIIFGGDIFVDSSITVAKRFKIPTIIIGATIVSIATTMPELFVSVLSSIDGAYTLAVGNAVGSVICNTGLIAGLSMALLPTILQEKTSPIKFYILIISALLLFVFGFDFKVEWYEGLVLFILFLFYMIINVLDAKGIKLTRSERQKQSLNLKDYTLIQSVNTAEISTVDEHGFKKPQKLFVTILLFVLGAVMIAGGAYLLIDGTKYVAATLGMSEAFIGVTVVALGTSLPELVTTITSIKKKNTALGYGNIIGANILNILLLMGLSGIISGNNGLVITLLTQWITIPLSILLTLIFILPIAIKGKTYKWQGICMLSLYLAYMVLLIILTGMGIAV